MVGEHLRAVVQDDQALDEVLELAHVPGPALGGQQRQGLGVQRAAGASVGFRREASEMASQDHDVTRARAEGGHLEGHDVEAIK